MKAGITTSFLCLLAVACAAAPQPPRLAGIVHTPKLQAALIEIQQERGSPKWSILRAGERDGDCEVIAIDSVLGGVTLRRKRELLELRLPAGEEPASTSAVHLHNADVRLALELYQMLSGRTIIRSPSMVIAPVNLRTPPTLADADCAAAIEKAVNQQGLIFKPRGTAFTFVVSGNEEKRVDAIPDPPVPGDPARDEVFPPGLMKFVDTDIHQVLEVYGELVEPIVLRPHSVPHFKVSVRSQSALSRSQAIWVLEAAMALGDLVIVPLNRKFVFAVPPWQVRNLPKFDGATLAATAKQGPDPEPIRLTEGATLALLKHYAAVVGRKPVTNNIPKARVWLNSKTPLSPVDTVFALEATAALNNLAFESVEPDGVTLRPAGALQKKENRK